MVEFIVITVFIFAIIGLLMYICRFIKWIVGLDKSTLIKVIICIVICTLIGFYYHAKIEKEKAEERLLQQELLKASQTTGEELTEEEEKEIEAEIDSYLSDRENGDDVEWGKYSFIKHR